MAIYRVEKNKNYTSINNTGLKDARLTWKAKGILAYVLSLPDDWTFYVEEISRHSKDGIDSLRAGLKELKEFGYINRFPIKDDSGKIVKWETVIYEVPQVEPEPDLPHMENPHMEKPYMENPHMEKPYMENPTLLNTNSLLITNKQKCTPKNSYSDDFEKFWSVYPNKKQKKRAYEEFKKVIKKYPISIIVQAAEKYARSTKKEYIKYPERFFSHETYKDYMDEQTPVVNIGQHTKQNSFTDEVASEFDVDTSPF